MLASFAAELLKLKKRPAAWVVALVFALCIVLFSYLFVYAFTVNAPEDSGVPSEARDSILRSLLPEGMLPSVLAGFANFGSALALILGALSVGSEYGWATLKVILTQRPGRYSIFLGMTLALALNLLILTIAIIAVGALCSYIVAVLEDGSIEWPSAGGLLKGLGAGWLILVAFAAMGVFLATLFRGTALAIGLGLVYLLVLESLFAALSSQSETVEHVSKWLPFKNSVDLAGSFGDLPVTFGGTPGDAVEPSQAILVLVLYTVAFLGLATLLLRSRDVA
ncbi:ABC transporter permease subunit [Rubrobacter radiotolerans]|uniref:ABC transporter permease subunit n=1 Tax=Rubrobacter radiotolerans TaxID=42256 RepID=A0AB35T767_RUBRA|nr:ABC transporter permease subunit [Rubrobacter radiotolerans]MDX5895318.1 ABC transporter permease subunit [Rubrobacter radiotolerans]SMC01633.1 ABC-2 family transporter protein [Rubrobacter radiotolerans DSM 5868]